MGLPHSRGASLWISACLAAACLVPVLAAPQSSADQEEAAGRRRLTAMLKLDVIFNQYGYTNLPPEVLKQVRDIARENWAVLPRRIRKDLRPYFAVEELAALDRAVPPPGAPPVWLPEEGTPPPAPAPAPQPISMPAPPPAVAAPISGAAPISTSPAHGIVQPFRAAEPAAAPRWETPTPAVNPSTTPATAAASAVAISSAAATAEPPPLPAYLEVSPAVLDQFLAEAPYSRDVKALLKLIYGHALPEHRRSALGIVMRYLPRIEIDPVRTDGRARAARIQLHSDLAKPGGYFIALNDRAAPVKKTGFWLGSESYLLPKATDYIQPLGLAAADLRNPGGSPEIQFTPEQVAGTLLKELLGLDAHLRGWDSDAYRAELRAETAQFIFYDSLRRDTGKPPVLTEDLLADFNEWHERPEDYLDFKCQALSAPARAIVAPSLSGSVQEREAKKRRHDLLILKESGLADKSAAQEALASTPATSASAAAGPGLIQELSALDGRSFMLETWITEEDQFLEQAHEKK